MSRPRSTWATSTAAAWWLVALGGCAEPPSTTTPAARPNVLLVTVDTLRPDALGWVAGANDTPALDALAREGFRFPAAVSPVPLTHPAHASMFTGLVPRRHGARDNGQVLGAGPALLAEVLRGHGYATAAFVSGYPLSAIFGLDRGFDHYDDELTAGDGAWLERPAPATTRAALDWLATARGPWLLWVHYYDPHLPYAPPPELARPGPRGAYDGEVAAVDRSFAELRRGVARFASEPVLTVFAADHGESLGEHGESTHGFFIYESTVAVPLVFYLPGRVPQGESTAPARLVDVTPTILDLLGLPPLAGVDGTSLVPVFSGAEPALPPAYVETLQPWISYGWAPLRGVRHGPWKLIAAPRPELYNLEDDPGEERNVILDERAAAAELRRHLDAAEALAPAAAETVADPEALARLQALGYLGGAPASAEPPAGLPDPKDRRELRELLTQGVELLERGDVEGAVARFDEVLAVEPANRFALSRSGAALLRLGRLGRAIERLRHAVRLNPAEPETRFVLAEALTRAGAAGAVDEWMEVVALQPRRAPAWSNLGTALGRAGRVDEAIAALARAAELEPHDPGRLIRLAFAEHAGGDLEAAAGHFREAAERTGVEAFPHSGALGLILLELGRREEARVWLERSRPGEGDYEQARRALGTLTP